jgi:hypothetical protein
MVGLRVQTAALIIEERYKTAQRAHKSLNVDTTNY